jgi:hypothetical protein
MVNVAIPPALAPVDNSIERPRCDLLARKAQAVRTLIEFSLKNEMALSSFGWRHV